jgi:zinc protease
MRTYALDYYAKMQRCEGQRNGTLSPLSANAMHALTGSLRLCVAILMLFGSTLFAQKPDRSGPPPVGPRPTFTMAPVQHFTLSNGLQVVLVEKHQVPLVQINLVIKSGAVDEPASKTGVASLVAGMLTDGAGSRDALAFADAVDYLGASLDGECGLHTSSLSLHTLVSKMDSALALMADAALRPAFLPTELERERKQRLNQLISWRTEARVQASIMFARTLYGNEHPYGRTALASEQAINSISTDDLRAFHHAYYRPNNAALVVVGDVTEAIVKPQLERTFGGWQQGPITPKPLPPVTQVHQRTITLVDKPGAAQSDIRIGCIGVPRVTDDYYAIVVMNTILGGSFTSRLNQNLREEHGYTYGASSRFDFRKSAGPFLAASAVHTAKTDSALLQFFKELEGMRQPIPQEDVDRAKNYVALGFPGDFQTVGSIAAMIEDMVIYGLPDDYYGSYIGNILAVTKADVERVAKKYLDPAKMAVVLVGDRKETEAKIAALKLGPVTNLTVDDVLGTAPKE